MIPVRPDGDRWLVDVLVQPRASRVRIGPVLGDRLKVAITAPPVDGAANTAVVVAVAKALKIAKSNIEITSGHTGRRKTLRITGVNRAALEDLAQ